MPDTTPPQSPDEKTGDTSKLLTSTLHLKPLQILDTTIEYYEEILMVILSAIMAIISAAGLYHVCKLMIHMAMGGEKAIFEPHAIPEIFQAIFTVLIAMEFKSSFLSSYHDNDTASDNAVRTLNHICPVILIGILAIVRHALTLNFETITITEAAAMATILIALGVVYALLQSTISHRRQANARATTPQDGN